MGASLGTVADILQIISGIGMFIAAIKWGEAAMIEYNFWVIALAGVIALSVLASLASLADKLGILPHKLHANVFDRHFKNEIVIVDKKAFYNCIFEDVTLKYAGGLFRMERCQALGKTTFLSASPPVGNTIRLLSIFNALNPELSQTLRSVSSLE